MKHTDWLRLHREGESICAIAREQGYLCYKQAHRLSWKLHKPGQITFYLLTWFPAPINEWNLLPNDTNPERTQLYGIIQQTLTKRRTEETKRQTQAYSYPWTIVRLLPDARRYTVARFYNRQDAWDHLRLLNRFIPAAEFEVVFDVPDEN